MNHFIIKLITGEVVYGKLSADSIEKKMIVVHDPLCWEEYMNEEGSTGSALVKFCNGTDETEVPISHAAVISMNKMSPDFSKFYDTAVELQKMTDNLYNKRLQTMTGRMLECLNDYYAANRAEETGDIVAYSILPDTEDTIH